MALLYEVDKHLNSENCASAIALIDQAYNTTCTTNAVRMRRAAAYACAAGLNYFDFLDSMVQNPTAICAGASCAGLWPFLAQAYDNMESDDHIEASWQAIESSMATLNLGAVINPGERTNFNTYNPGSLDYLDRTDDANSYLAFTAMAHLGGSLNRNGNPVPVTYMQGTALPWITPALIQADTEGCSTAAAFANIADGMVVNSQLIGGTYANMGDTLQSILLTVCQQGCAGVLPTGCTLAAADCTPCAELLRHRSNCRQNTTTPTQDPVACAAAGIIIYMNTDWL